MTQTLFLDMDGVVADWRAGAARIAGYAIGNEQMYPNDVWERIRNDQRIFRDLPKMPGADQLVDAARKFRDQLGWDLLFLTAIPHYNDIHWAFWDKVTWAQQRYPDIPVHFGPYSQDKQRHCRVGDILVDDRTSNCQQWRAQNGVALQVVDYDLTWAINELSQLFVDYSLIPRY